MSRPVAVLARVLTLVLMLSILVMHVPLDVLRARAATAPSSQACCTTVDPGSPAHGSAVGEAAPSDSPDPDRRDGCDEGCHCGCCGRLPIAAESSASAPAVEPLRDAQPAELHGARVHEPRDVFHPPRA